MIGPDSNGFWKQIVPCDDFIGKFVLQPGGVLFNGSGCKTAKHSLFDSGAQGINRRYYIKILRFGRFLKFKSTGLYFAAFIFKTAPNPVASADKQLFHEPWLFISDQNGSAAFIFDKYFGSPLIVKKKPVMGEHGDFRAYICCPLKFGYWNGKSAILPVARVMA